MENYIVGVMNNDGKWTESDTISVRRDSLTTDILSELRRRFYICGWWDVRIQFRMESKILVGYVWWNSVLICAVRKIGDDRK